MLLYAQWCGRHKPADPRCSIRTTVWRDPCGCTQPLLAEIPRGSSCLPEACTPRQMPSADSEAIHLSASPPLTMPPCPPKLKTTGDSVSALFASEALTVVQAHAERTSISHCWSQLDTVASLSSPVRILRGLACHACATPVTHCSCYPCALNDRTRMIAAPALCPIPVSRNAPPCDLTHPSYTMCASTTSLSTRPTAHP